MQVAKGQRTKVLILTVCLSTGVRWYPIENKYTTKTLRGRHQQCTCEILCIVRANTKYGKTGDEGSHKLTHNFILCLLPEWLESQEMGVKKWLSFALTSAAPIAPSFRDTSIRKATCLFFLPPNSLASPPFVSSPLKQAHPKFAWWLIAFTSTHLSRALSPLSP